VACAVGRDKDYRSTHLLHKTKLEPGQLSEVVLTNLHCEA